MQMARSVALLEAALRDLQTASGTSEDVDKGLLEPSARSRIVGAHLGLNTAVEVLKRINPNTLKEVYALHLSSRHADEKEVKQTIEQSTGKPCFIAGK